MQLRVRYYNVHFKELIICQKCLQISQVETSYETFLEQFLDCGFKTEVVAAFEINTTANSVYEYNFPETHLCQRNIEGLSAKDLEKMNADVFLMSPPCQPFTRVGLKGASSDPRCKSFLHILDLLSRLSKPPDYLLMENVKGFEVSETRDQFVNTLKERDYGYQEFLLSPNQFGIPNSRLRYYLLAKRKPHHFYFTTQEQAMDQIPPVKDMDSNSGDHHTSNASCNTSERNILQQRDPCSDDNMRIDKSRCEKDSIFHFSENEETCLASPIHLKLSQSDAKNLNEDRVNSVGNNYYQKQNFSLGGAKHKQTLTPLLEFLEIEKSEEYFNQFLLPDKVLSRLALVLDIVTPASTHSCCFTKAYGHYAEGTGSVLKTADIDDTEMFNEYRALGTDASDSQRAAVLADLRLRYFTPKEVANIMKFPKYFGFPQDISVKQQYRLLGNSLNIHVVAELLKCLFHT